MPIKCGSFNLKINIDMATWFISVAVLYIYEVSTNNEVGNFIDEQCFLKFGTTQQISLYIFVFLKFGTTQEI